MTFKKEYTTLRTTSRLIFNYYFEPTSENGFCLSFDYEVSSSGGFLSVFSEDIYGNEIRVI